MNDLQNEADEIGRSDGYNHANYADNVSGEVVTPEETDIEVPERFESVATYYTVAFLEGCAQYIDENYYSAGFYGV